MQYIYVIGAQCTGKTTLVEALGAWLRLNMAKLTFTTIKEAARTTLKLHHFTRDDVRAGGERCMALQKLILQYQVDVEKECSEVDLMISDRSGIDPLVYAQLYCGVDAAQEISQSTGWTELKARMNTGTVVVCEPVEAWLADDGTRLIPENNEEWLATHRLFCETLQKHQIPYVVLTASMVRLDERVNFVLAAAAPIGSST